MVKQHEFNGDVEMKPHVEKQENANVFLGGYPIRNPFAELAKIADEID